ncbi:glycosyltransferase family 9 protein [Prosthecobacter sp.]|uniref:glycosyltransferase family 9 protein n=1 Tax=Prosthecobacter sp. TaxID=1965333 RepID=UPI003783DB5D
MKPQPRVLVIRGGAIGDFILTLPALRLLRETIPGCHLEVLGYPAIAELARTAGLADSIRSLEHRTMAPLFAKTAPIDEALAEHLRSFNLVVSFLYDPDGHFRASMERIGVKTLIECSPLVKPEGPHASRQLAQGLEKLAMFLEDEHLHRAHFPHHPAPHPRIAIHPGSGSEKKNWPLQNWQQVAATFPHAEIIYITGEAEAERHIHPTGHTLWHSLPLPELAARLATCTAFLGHDSGISHLAAACGVPSLLLFGPTDPAIWAPPQPWIRFLRNPTHSIGDLCVEEVNLAAAQVVAKS